MTYTFSTLDEEKAAPKARISYRTKLGIRQRQEVFDALADGPMTSDQIELLTGLKSTSVTHYLRQLRGLSTKTGNGPRCAYIYDYPDKLFIAGRLAPRYAQGTLPDAPEPTAKGRPRLTDRDASRDALARARLARDAVESAVSKPQHWYSGLGL